MGKWRDESKELPCGCKIGRSGKGPWFYDYLCEIHVAEVYDKDGQYSQELSEALTKRLNKEMNKPKEDTRLTELSETEKKAYEFIKKAEQPLAIRDMPHQLQGTIGKLKKKDLIEVYRTQVQVSKHGFISMKKKNCVRVK